MTTLDEAFEEAWGFRNETRSLTEKMNARMWFNRGVDAAKAIDSPEETE